MIKPSQDESLQAPKSHSVMARFGGDDACGGCRLAGFAAFIAQRPKVWMRIVGRAGIVAT